jgi:hypothetical protein
MLLIKVSVLLNFFYEEISKLYTEEASENASVYTVTLTNKYIMSHQSNEQVCLIIIARFYSVRGTVHTCVQMYAILHKKVVGFNNKKTNTMQCERAWFVQHTGR